MTEIEDICSVDISACCKTCFNSDDVLVECDAIASNGHSIIEMLTALFPYILQKSGK